MNCSCVSIVQLILVELVETSYTVFTHVQWEGTRGSTPVGLHVFVVQEHSSVEALCGGDCIQTFGEKLWLANPFSENYQTVLKFLTV